MANKKGLISVPGIDTTVINPGTALSIYVKEPSGFVSAKYRAMVLHSNKNYFVAAAVKQSRNNAFKGEFEMLKINVEAIAIGKVEIDSIEESPLKLKGLVDTSISDAETCMELTYLYGGTD